MNLMFFLSNVLLGLALAADAFSVSLANGLNDQKMKPAKMLAISGTFGFFQGIMPFIGWLCIHYLLEIFNVLNKIIPYLSLMLLLILGIKMLIDGSKNTSETEPPKVGVVAVLVQALATSIDALSAGLTFATYDIISTLVAVLIIATITFALCFIGTILGKKFGTKLAGKATIFGGIILILIGLEIFITSFI